ncbi:hypothetical protein [Streptomyces bluensis]|uniref:hypothetical protein n=1 Tax=Streptomyces bluensis TaxID=33897 RepID=UPI003322F9A2
MSAIETVNGVTFDPASLFFEYVGVDTDAKPFCDESWIHPAPSSFQEAKDYARAMCERAPLVTFIRIRTQVTDDLSIRVATVWKGAE